MTKRVGRLTIDKLGSSRLADPPCPFASQLPIGCCSVPCSAAAAMEICPSSQLLYFLFLSQKQRLDPERQE